MESEENKRKKEMIDLFIKENYKKIQLMIKKVNFKNKNTIYEGDVMGEFYLFLIDRIEKNNNVEELEKAMAYFFACQYFKDSAIKKLNEKNKYVKFYKIEDIKNVMGIDDVVENNYEEEIIEEKIQELNVKVKTLPPAYQNLYDIVFIQKKWRHTQIAEELNTTIYAARQLRTKLVNLLKLDENKLNFYDLNK